MIRGGRTQMTRAKKWARRVLLVGAQVFLWEAYLTIARAALVRWSMRRDAVESAVASVLSCIAEHEKEEVCRGA